jgi:hypothetical protein
MGRVQPSDSSLQRATATFRSGAALSRWRPWLLGGVLVAATLALRAPTFTDHILFIDEPIYYTFGSRLELPGAHVYTHTADQKPPLGPLTYWLAIQVSARHAILVVHVFTTVAIAATALLLLWGSQLLRGEPWAGLAAGALYVLIGSSKPPRGEAFFAFSSLEHFQAPLLLGFLLLFLLGLQRPRAWVAGAAGVLLGIAALYKPNVPVLLIPAWGVAVFAGRRRRLPPRAVAGAGAAAATSTVAVMLTAPLYYAAIGHFDAWRYYNIDALLLYRGLGGSLSQEAARLAAAIPLKVPLALGLLYGMGGVPPSASARWDRELGWLLAGTWLALFCSLTPGLHKAHYLIQGLPAQCLLIGMSVVAGWHAVAAARGRGRVMRGAAYIAIVVAPLAVALYHLALGWRALAAYACADGYLALHRRAGTLAPLVRYIQNHSAPHDLIYVHSEAPELYFLTQRRPAVSDATGGWIALLASARAADDLLAALQASPPRLIIQLAYRRYGRSRETLQKWPQLASWLRQHYHQRTTIPHAQVLEWSPPPADP